MCEEIFTLDVHGDLTMKHIVTEILPRLYLTLDEVELLDNEKKGYPLFSSEILIGFNGKLFEICSDFSVFRYEKYQVIGSLADYALAKVTNIDENEDINRQLVDALRICAKNTEYVGAPYLTIDTKDLKYQVWEEN